MTQIDTSIYGQFIRPGKSALEIAGDYDQLKQNKLAQMMNQAKMDEYTRGVASEKAEADAHRSAMGTDGKIDRNKLYSSLAQSGHGAKIAAAQKGHADQDKAQRDAQKSEIELHLQRLELLERESRGVGDQASYSAFKQRALSNPLLADGAAAMPDVFDPVAFKSNMGKALSFKDKLAAHHQELTRDLAERQFGETVRHNSATEGLSRSRESRIGSGGGGGGGGGGGSRGKAPTGYRWTADGGQEPIPGGPKDKSQIQEKPIPRLVVKQVQEARDSADTMDRLNTSFETDFGDKGILGLGAEMQLSASSTFGADQKSVAWWKDYRKQAELTERHAMFGAALTPSEQAAWRSADIGPGMSSATIKTNLATRAALTKKVAEATADDMISAGHSEERITAIANRGKGGAAPTVPKVGEVKKGYRFKGGDPSKPSNWEKQ